MTLWGGQPHRNGQLSPRSAGGFASPSDAATASAAGWQDAQLKTLEARITAIEEEHRVEVASLRHALEECVHAIGTCARAIDTMCVDVEVASRDTEPPRESVAAATMASPARQGEWERAAAALHDAASLGRIALGGGNAGHSNGASLPSNSGAATPIDKYVVSPASHAYWRGQNAKEGTPVSVEVTG